METEYNEPLVSETFLVLNSIDHFREAETPENLRGRDIEFEFKSPLKELEKESKPQSALEGMQFVQAAAQFDPALAKKVNADKVTEDVLRAIGWDEDWLTDEKDYDQSKQEMLEAMAKKAELAEAGQMSEVARNAAPAIQAAGQLEEITQ